MIAEIQQYGPITCGINSAELSKYISGILDTDLTSLRIDHFVLVYGWGSENG